MELLEELRRICRVQGFGFRFYNRVQGLDMFFSQHEGAPNKKSETGDRSQHSILSDAKHEALMWDTFPEGCSELGILLPEGLGFRV